MITWGKNMRSVQQPCELEEIFATRLCESHEFRSWLLSRTKFAKLWPLARLLNKEQQTARGGGAWWRNWNEPQDGAAGMFLGFELEQTRLRFALHVCCAQAASQLHDAEIQRQRASAESMINQERFLNYMDFETVLLAPQALILCDARTLNFDRRIPFETVAGFVPQFGPGYMEAVAA